MQNQYDSYEKWSLVIKLVNIVLSCVLLASIEESAVVLLPVAILWLQDAIWKTFQSRIGERILVVEQGIAVGDEQLSVEQLAMQFNRQWLAARPPALALLAEYCRQAVKPTVAYPHVGLVALTVYVAIML